MIVALKVRPRRRTKTIPVGIDADDEIITREVEYIDLEGIDERALCATAAVEEDVEQVMFCDDSALPAGARRLRPADVPERPDLGGARALRVVPSGWPHPNATVNARGELTPLNEVGKPIAVEEPGELGAEVGEVIR